ncbi:MAG: hypothetical protein EOP05_20505 [Proteobacteria bacterium]|nr:MAG: hypothetical protein EOP05_20505 [Pseudomonadota bacterium]
MRAAILKAAAIAALIAAAAATPAYAQDSAAKAPATDPSVSNDGSADDGLGSSVTKSGTSTLNTNTTSPLTTSSASLPSAVKAAQPRSVFAELYSETAISMKNFENGTGRAKLATYGGVKFDLGNTNSLSLRQNFDFMSNASSGGGNVVLQDTVVNFTRGKLAEFKDGTTLTMIARAYAPTGENSKNIGQHAQERLYLIASKSLGKFDLTYVLMGRAFQQSRSYNQSTNDKGEIEYAQTPRASLTNEIDAFYNFNPKLALGMIVGMDNVAMNRAPGKSSSLDDIYFQPTIQIAPVKGLTLQAYLYDELDIRNPKAEQRLFSREQTSVNFNIAAQL